MEKSIEINAPASKVWKILTDSGLIREWVKEWWPNFAAIESTWKPGSPIRWRTADGAIAIEGKILGIKPNALLSFRAKGGPPEPVDQTFTLRERDGRTTLRIRIGYSGNHPGMKPYFLRADENYDRYFFPKIKELAEK